MEGLPPNLLTGLLAGGFSCAMLGPLHGGARDPIAVSPQVHEATERETKMKATVSCTAPSQNDTLFLLPYSIGHTEQP